MSVSVTTVIREIRKLLWKLDPGDLVALWDEQLFRKLLWKLDPGDGI